MSVVGCVEAERVGEPTPLVVSAAVTPAALLVDCVTTSLLLAAVVLDDTPLPAALLDCAARVEEDRLETGLATEGLVTAAGVVEEVVAA